MKGSQLLSVSFSCSIRDDCKVKTFLFFKEIKEFVLGKFSDSSGSLQRYVGEKIKKNVIQSEIVPFYLSLDIFEVYSGGTVFPRPQQKKMKKLKYLILEQKSYISLCQTR